MRFMPGERRGKDRGQGGDGAIHQAGEPGLDDLQHKQAAAGALFFAPRSVVQIVAPKLLGAGLMLALFLGKVIEQLPDTGIGSSRSRFLVKDARLHLERRGLPARGFRPQGLLPERRRKLELTAAIPAEDAQLPEPDGPVPGGPLPGGSA